MRKVKDAKTTSYKIRLTPAELEHAREQARAAGIPLAVLVRQLLAGVQIRTVADTEVLAELRRQGGLCKHLCVSGAPADATSAALAELGRIAGRLIGEGGG